MFNDNEFFRKMNLQFFAEEDGGSGEDSGDESGKGDEGNGAGSNDGSGDGDQSQKKTGKTFTQEELNNVGKTEKEKGKRSALKSLGFDDEKTAKAEIEEYKKWKSSQMTDQQKSNAEKKDLESKKSAAEIKAQVLENKLTALELGVNKDSVDDVIALASVKVTEDKTLEEVLKEMKEQPKYKSFFEDSDSEGTGTDVNHGKKGGKTTGLGERLAKANQSQAKKSSYFSK